MRLLSATLLALAVSTPLHGQDSTGTGHRYPAPPTVRAAGVHAEYDPQFNKTVLQLDPTPVDASLRLSALVALDGRVVQKDADGVVVTLWSSSAEKRFQAERSVSLTIDGTATLTIGDHAFELSPQLLAAIRDFTSRMAPAR